MISTLRKTVKAMGGTLALVAQFPDSEPVILLASPKMTRRTGPTDASALMRACSGLTLQAGVV
jgi:hypothetical protein